MQTSQQNVMQFFLLRFIFAICDSHGHLTCLRTGDLFLTPPAQPPVQIQQGFPGIQDPIGSKGSAGQKDGKGDPGVLDNSLVDSLRGWFLKLFT